MPTQFIHLNNDWNAEPNAPEPIIKVSGRNLLLFFYVNAFMYPQFTEGDIGKLTFVNCSQYRLGSTNDEGWYRDQCRFSKLAPQWGEFYEITGDLLLDRIPEGWREIAQTVPHLRHFLFYFRDNTFECDAEDWIFEVKQTI